MMATGMLIESATRRGTGARLRFSDALHALWLSPPPLPPLQWGGKSGVWSFSPLAKGYTRGSSSASALRRLRHPAIENRSDPIQGTQIRGPVHNPAVNAAKQFSVSQSRTSTTGKPASRVFS